MVKGISHIIQTSQQTESVFCLQIKCSIVVTEKKVAKNVDTLK